MIMIMTLMKYGIIQNGMMLAACNNMLCVLSDLACNERPSCML